MSFFGRGISAFFNQFFRWLFWNKTGQKLLFSILVVFIFFCFIKLGEVSAVEEVNDINYEAFANYDSIINDAILRLGNNPRGSYEDLINRIKDGGYDFYFYYGQNDGSSYNGAFPTNKYILHIIYFSKGSTVTKTISNYDYRALTSIHQYVFDLSNASNFGRYDLNGNYVAGPSQAITSYYQPMEFYGYYNQNWIDFVDNLVNNKDAEMVQLLQDIKAEQQATNEALTNTTPTSETDSFVDVDTSAVEDISSAQVDNVFSSMTTNFANKFTNYDLTTTYSFVWNLNGTNITFYSDTLYKMIKGTFFETLLSMLWYYIFGHYAFVWLSNIIHKIKDGSILDGLEVNEVITKEML